MAAHLSIGDFSRATHLTIKTLRHYHRIGLLEPADIDPNTGYRRYAVEQLSVAQVIRRFRDLGMPLEEIRGVLSASDLDTRSQHITAHLRHLERELDRTQSAVTSIRDLLATPPTDPSDQIELRTVPAVTAAVITDVVGVEESAAWLQGALGEIRGTLGAGDRSASGPAGGIYTDQLFTEHRGQVTIFVPCDEPVRPLGRVTQALIPATELAVIEHRGPPAEVDRAYGTLAAFVARHAIGIDGPIREYYLLDQQDTPDHGLWRTEIGWPVFRTSRT
jgi:DNA-binding transcriptional MerR regulator/effector-binding domain-containing protein